MTTELIFPGILPGNNGKFGLLRMHWRKRNQLRDTYVWRVKSMTKNRHLGPVRLELIRYHVGQQLDYDNLVATGKIVIDSIVLAGVILDDKTAVIKERDYSQVKVKSKLDQKTVIIIDDL